VSPLRQMVSIKLQHRKRPLLASCTTFLVLISDTAHYRAVTQGDYVTRLLSAIKNSKFVITRTIMYAYAR
jgi:hypothetical protein